MDAASSPRKPRPTTSPSHGRVREVEDDELFGHLLLQSRKSQQRLQRQKSALQAARRQQPKKRPRSSGFSEIPPLDKLMSLDDNARTKKKHIFERSTSQGVGIRKGEGSQRDVSQKDDFTSSLFVDDSRHVCSPSPRTYDEIIGRFAPMGDTSKMDGVPRLSSLALGVARTYAARGQLVDLSDLADSHVHEILGHKDLSASVLMKLETLNPSRINVLEASWARLVLNEFGIRELPPRIKRWRMFYEMKKREDQISLERARARLKQRYDAADANRNKRLMETTRVLGVVGKRKTKSPSNSMSRIAQLRMEMKRERRKR